MGFKLPNPTLVSVYYIQQASLWSSNAYAGPQCVAARAPSSPAWVTPIGTPLTLTAPSTGGTWALNPSGVSSGNSSFYAVDIPVGVVFPGLSTNVIGVAIQSQGGPDPIATANAGSYVQQVRAQGAAST